MATSIKDKLVAFSTQCPETQCWIWRRSTIKGYGKTCHKGKSRYAHRVSYEVFVGPIPEGKRVCHKCDTPLCINPAHLFLGTQKENIHDALNKGRMNHPKRQAHWKTTLTEEDVAYIRSSTEKSVRLAEKFGVAPNSISSIRRGHRWK